MVVLKAGLPRTLVALFDHIEKCNSCFSRPTVARSFTPDLSPCTIRSPQFSSQSLRTRILSCRSCWEHKSIFFYLAAAPRVLKFVNSETLSKCACLYVFHSLMIHSERWGERLCILNTLSAKGGSFLWWEIAWSGKGTQQIFKEIQGLCRCQVLNCRLNIWPQCLARSAFLFFTFLTTKSCPHVWYYIKINLQNYQFYNSLHQPQWHDSMTLEGGSSLVLQKSEPTRN